MTAKAKKLIETAVAAAVEIERTAAECEMSYLACQSFYGVDVESLIGDEWIDRGDFDEARARVKAVRLFDCDGERGQECRTIEEVEAERDRWIHAIQNDVCEA